MASYEIKWKSSAEKELRGIHTDFVPRIVEAAESLADDPFPVAHCKLVGGSGSYRVRVGDYRMVYQEGTGVCIYLAFARRRSLVTISLWVIPFLPCADCVCATPSFSKRSA